MKKAKDFKIPLREILPQMWKKQKIAFSTDMWTDSFNKNAYLNLMVIICLDFTLVNYCLCCKKIGRKKTGEEIRKFLAKELLDYHINVTLTSIDKIKICFTTDCGTNLKNALNDIYRFDCNGHRLNTVFKTALNDVKIEFPSVKIFFDSCHKFVKHCKKSSINNELEYSLKADIDTRWNYNFHHLHSILINYEQLDRLLKENQDYHKALQKFLLIDKETLKELVNFLKPFQFYFENIQKENEPTLQYVVLNYYSIIDECEKVTYNQSTFLKYFKERIIYWLKEKVILEKIHWAATFLDPTFKNLSMLNKYSIIQNFILFCI